jgi:hypothetical protein
VRLEVAGRVRRRRPEVARRLGRARVVPPRPNPFDPFAHVAVFALVHRAARVLATTADALVGLEVAVARAPIDELLAVRQVARGGVQLLAARPLTPHATEALARVLVTHALPAAIHGADASDPRCWRR